MEGFFEWLNPLMEMYAGKFGVLVSVISIIGTLRLFVKPVMSLWLAIVEITPNKKDDEFLAKFKESKAYQVAVYILDWFGSVKLPK